MKMNTLSPRTQMRVRALLRRIYPQVSTETRIRYDPDASSIYIVYKDELGYLHDVEIVPHAIRRYEIWCGYSPEANLIVVSRLRTISQFRRAA